MSTANTAMIARKHKLKNALRISSDEKLMYPSVARPNARLNHLKNTPSGPRDSFFGFSSSAHIAGLSDNALNAENTTEIAIVTANCWYKRPVMPGIKIVGKNTATRISAIATTGPDTSSIACSAAFRGDIPSSIWCSTASTTTIASSTTSPIASTNPKSDSVFTENPSIGNTANVPINDTGTASSGINVARHPCRKMNTTIITSSNASNSVCSISFMPEVTASVVSSATL